MAVDRTPEFHQILDEIGYAASKVAGVSVGGGPSTSTGFSQLYTISEDI